jgi:F-type H+-transporting ATPase subunit b
MDNMISLDHSLFIQLANFIVTIVVLNFLLIQPVRRQLAERKSLTEKLVSEAEDFSALSAGRLTAYERALTDARAAAALTRDEIKTEGEAAQREMLRTADASATGFLQSSRKVCASECRAAADALLAGADGFASLVVQKILA